MSDLSGIGKTVEVLAKMVSDTCGVLYEPRRIILKAKAESEASIIRAKTDIQIEQLRQEVATLSLPERAQNLLTQSLQRESRIQENISSILDQALPHISVDAQPEKLEPDWLADVLNRCSLISDQEMQSLWGKIIAGQINNPRSFSKRTMVVVSEIDKKDALAFTRLCTSVWVSGGTAFPFIIDESEIHLKMGFDLSFKMHLESIGLISRVGFGSIMREITHPISISYFNRDIILAPGPKDLLQGPVELTMTGRELFPICGAQPSEEYYNYMIDYWRKEGYTVTETNPGDPK
ncbi:MAG: DUF2806 domain-containing protein [Magnetococcales bacterium]|nr:DUF2806 domain-containing protein [Magnetococcales bacterium]